MNQKYLYIYTLCAPAQRTELLRRTITSCGEKDQQSGGGRRRHSLRRRPTSRFSSARRRTLSLRAYVLKYAARASTPRRAENDPRDRHTRRGTKPPRAHTHLPPAGGSRRFSRRIGDARRTSTSSGKSRTRSRRGPAGSPVNFPLRLLAGNCRSCGCRVCAACLCDAGKVSRDRSL